MGPQGGSGGGRPRRKRGLLFGAIAVALVVTVTAVVVSSHGSGKNGKNSSSDSAGGGTMAAPAGGQSWNPPSWANAADDIGPANPKMVVTGQVWFAKAKPQNLAQYAQEVGTPGDPNYHKFLSADAFSSTFSAGQGAGQAVTEWVKQDGMRIINQDSQSITVSTTIAKVEDALKIKIHRYKHDGRVDIAPTSQPQYPANVGDYVSAVTGLTTSSPVGRASLWIGADNPNCSRFYGERSSGLPAGPDGVPAQLMCGYTAQQLRTAYGATASGMTGQGVTVAIVDAYASPTIVQDVNRWSREMGLPELKSGQFSQYVPTSYDPTRTSAADAAGWWGEETLDVEAVHAMAPDAKIIYYGAQSTDDASFYQAFQNIISHGSAQIVSNSWSGPELGTDESAVAAGRQIYEQGAVEGINFNFSTGDNGDFTVGDKQKMSSPSVGYPASDPWVTGVGGTSLGTDSSGGYKWETGWGSMDYPGTGSGWGSQGTFDGAGGGGVSAMFPQPPYQVGVVPDALAKPDGNAHRVLPDVSMDADLYTGMDVGMTVANASARPKADGSVVYVPTGGVWRDEPVGGTSLACPLFSGMEALAIQNSGSRLGFANPALYKQYASASFHDVVPNPAALGGHEPSFAYTGDQGPVLVREDQNTSLKTAQGFDDITGIGSPAGAFITWFKDHPNGQ
ncbi:protease pro-enzyme activation domain-containing protein [Streptacidiphilus sp. MAP12-33]|uniref:S53 family peptidase n=1 Tax=Streptacidiphilus sp. MAP12-33 TaxID=3156266 RepID=UPI003512BCBC